MLACVGLAACACQTAQKPVSLLPPGKAPALQSSTPPAQAPSTSSTTAPPQVEDGPPQKAGLTESAVSPNSAPAPASDEVADLIARAEKEYRIGLANQQAGKTEEAKQNFDNALNALLSSNLDVRSDERLQQEFDRIVAGVNQLEPGGHGDRCRSAAAEVRTGANRRDQRSYSRARCQYQSQGAGRNQEYPF